MTAWVNTTRADVCECGCDTDIHDIDGPVVYCPNCGVECDEIEE